MVYAFLVLAALAVGFAVVAVAHRNPVVSVLSLVLVFFALAALYALLGMDFLAAIQLIVYSGAVLVLFLFVIMLLALGRVERLGSGRPFQAVLGTVAATGLGGLAVWAVRALRPGGTGLLPGADDPGTAFLIGRKLLTAYLFPFEFISVLLVAALVGALVLARREER